MKYPHQSMSCSAAATSQSTTHSNTTSIVTAYSYNLFCVKTVTQGQAKAKHFAQPQEQTWSIVITPSDILSMVASIYHVCHQPNFCLDSPQHLF